MKKLLVGLLAIGSVLSYADDNFNTYLADYELKEDKLVLVMEYEKLSHGRHKWISSIECNEQVANIYVTLNYTAAQARSSRWKTKKVKLNVKDICGGDFKEVYVNDEKAF